MRTLAAGLAVLLCALPAVPVLADPGDGYGDGGDGASGDLSPQVRGLYDQGMDHVRAKRWALAAAAFAQAVRAEPRFVEAWNMLGYAYRKLKDNTRALEAYRRALELRPDFKYAHEYIGRLYLAMGNRAQAMRHYEILRRLDATLAAQLLRAIEADNPDLGEPD
ncbi:MAG: tetratricopeptide repeat protein [Firmicutes bacterium]|jgi:tetratricopeptide (TPR) repeat protein|nr:tetratricopeptide repeat protein [Bacillota bacterium]